MYINVNRNRLSTFICGFIFISAKCFNHFTTKGLRFDDRVTQLLTVQFYTIVNYITLCKCDVMPWFPHF